jgi:hypothetical protein
MNKPLILQNELMICISLMKQQFVITHIYAVLRETGKFWQIINRLTLKHAVFLGKYTYKEKHFFFGHNIVREDVFVTRVFL